MKNLLKLIYTLPFIVPQSAFAQTHSHSSHHTNSSNSDPSFFILTLGFLAFVTFFFILKRTNFRMNFFKTLVALSIFALFITHIIPSYGLSITHDSGHVHAEKHVCCMPSISSVSDVKVVRISISIETLVLKPTEAIVGYSKNSNFNKSPPIFS